MQKTALVSGAVFTVSVLFKILFFDSLDNLGEYLGITHSYLRQDFSVELYVFRFLNLDEFPIRHSVQANGVIETCNPERSIRSFFRSSVAVCIFSRFEQSFFRGAIV